MALLGKGRVVAIRPVADENGATWRREADVGKK